MQALGSGASSELTQTLSRRCSPRQHPPRQPFSNGVRAAQSSSGGAAERMDLKNTYWWVSRGAAMRGRCQRSGDAAA